MKTLILLLTATVLATASSGSWYWPFGSDDDATEPPRISELMEPASQMIDDAVDLAADGKLSESIAKYREALADLERVERENPERAKGNEFATLRNKRSFVNAAIDALQLRQVQSNARAVAVSDTTELEKKLEEERTGKSESKPEPESKPESKSKPEGERTMATGKPPKPPKPLTKREQAMTDIANGDYAAAELIINEMLAAKPNGAMALNLKAAMQMKQGLLKEAEATLDQAISSNPRNFSAYYNMAFLLLQKDAANKPSAKRYYETGRAMGGAANAELEELVK